MIIRKPIPKDVEQLIDLCAAHAAYERVSFNKSQKKEKLNKQLFSIENNLQCLVVENNNQLVGYATYMKQFSTWGADFYVYMDCLFLKETSRGNGLGKQLMGKIKEYAIAENCIEIQWQTPNFNSRAISFYKRLGAGPKTKERFFWNV